MLTRSEAEGALRDLVFRLDERRWSATIYIVGGTALMLGFDARQSTRDVDAVVTPRDRVLAVAAEIAELRNLPDDWLSTDAAIFVPPHPEDRVGPFCSRKVVCVLRSRRPRCCSR